jgi:hypothetical protein
MYLLGIKRSRQIELSVSDGNTDEDIHINNRDKKSKKSHQIINDSDDSDDKDSPISTGEVVINESLGQNITIYISIYLSLYNGTINLLGISISKKRNQGISNASGDDDDDDVLFGDISNRKNNFLIGGDDDDDLNSDNVDEDWVKNYGDMDDNKEDDDYDDE